MSIILSFDNGFIMINLGFIIYVSITEDQTKVEIDVVNYHAY